MTKETSMRRGTPQWNEAFQEYMSEHPQEFTNEDGIRTYTLDQLFEIYLRNLDKRIATESETVHGSKTKHLFD